MNVVADEGVDREIVESLRKKGHHVWYVAEMAPTTPDSEILDIAHSQQAILITYDKDFGELVFRQHKVHYGVLLLRLEGMTSDHKSNYVVDTLTEHSGRLQKGFGVLSRGQFRIRIPDLEIL